MDVQNISRVNGAVDGLAVDPSVTQVMGFVLAKQKAARTKEKLLEGPSPGVVPRIFNLLIYGRKESENLLPLYHLGCLRGARSFCADTTEPRISVGTMEGNNGHPCAAVYHIHHTELCILLIAGELVNT